MGLDWGVILDNLPFLARGLWNSVQLAFITVALSFPLGCVVALGRISRRRWLRYPATALVHGLRSNPLILVVFWFFFLVPILTGRPVGDFLSVLVAFVIFFSAYFAEIVRSGIQSVRRSQLEAAMSTGLTYAQAMRLVVLPQALRSMTPSLVTECIIVFQGTTIAYVVGMREFLHTTFLITERTLRPVELYLFAALVYFVVCFASSVFARRLEGRLGMPR
jgi:glutamate/aspartate transport system permease protein